MPDLGESHLARDLEDFQIDSAVVSKNMTENKSGKRSEAVSHRKYGVWMNEASKEEVKGYRPPRGCSYP